MKRLSMTIPEYAASIAVPPLKTQTRRVMTERAVVAHLMGKKNQHAPYRVGEVVALTLPHWRYTSSLGGCSGVFDEVTGLGRWEDKPEQTFHPSRLNAAWHKCPPFLMPAWSCLHFARILAIKAERVQDITEDDAYAEGLRCPPKIEVPRNGLSPTNWARQMNELNGLPGVRRLYHMFAALWDSINGKRPGCSWADNPWVWADTYALCERGAANG
jgi:hypothetical protein